MYNPHISPVAIITGITGQDGSYLAEHLIKEGYKVYGGIRRTSTSPANLGNLQEVIDSPNLKLFHLDMACPSSIATFIGLIFTDSGGIRSPGRPIEVYNLAAQSHVGESFNQPVLTHQVNAVAVTVLLSTLMRVYGREAFKFYQASTSELFGNTQYCDIDGKLDETTPMAPTSPYAIAKHSAYLTVKMYREAFGVYAVNGILFNHESPRRGEDFVTRKITKYVAAGDYRKPLRLGNLNALRDWGDARDYVKAMHLMMTGSGGWCGGDDFVVSTGTARSVREFVEAAFHCVGLPPLQWDGNGVEEQGFIVRTSPLVVVDPEYYRPSEVNRLRGSPYKIESTLGWTRRIPFMTMVKDMVTADMDSSYAS
jgi:GDPmannose 4,6-dehydratase